MVPTYPQQDVIVTIKEKIVILQIRIKLSCRCFTKYCNLLDDYVIVLF